MLQLQNLFNARRLGSTPTALSGIAEDPLFLIIAASIFVWQVIMTQFGGRVLPPSLRDPLLIGWGTSALLWLGEMSRGFRRRVTLASARA